MALKIVLLFTKNGYNITLEVMWNPTCSQTPLVYSLNDINYAVYYNQKLWTVVIIINGPTWDNFFYF